MQKYINYLVEDIRKASENLPSIPFINLPQEEEAAQEVMEYKNSSPKPMQEWFKISKDCFPPNEKLSKEQIEVLVTEILKLWSAFNFRAILPENLPVEIAYKLLVGYFDKPVIWVSKGTIDIEFCDQDLENCPFFEECGKCNNSIEKEIEIDSSENSSEIILLTKEIDDFFSDNATLFKPNVKMDKYVNQLIKDLKQIAKRIENRVRYPDNINIRSYRDKIDLLEKPFQSLEKLSGIKQNVFPEIYNLDGIQIKRLLIAILQFFDAYKLKIYHPDDIPPETKYEAITSDWDNIFVKDLPDSGDDIDLCTSDIDTCPYACFCNCEDDLDDDLPFSEEDDNIDDGLDNVLPF